MFKRIVLFGLLAVLALTAIACDAQTPAPAPTSQSAVADPVPPAATSTTKVTPPSGTSQTTARATTKVQPAASKSPVIFVPSTPTRVSTLSGSVNIEIREYQKFPTSADFVVVFPLLAYGSVVEGPSPAFKAAAVFAISSYLTLYAIEHRDDIAKAGIIVFEGTWSQIQVWLKTFDTAIIIEDLILQSKPIPPAQTWPDYSNGGKALQPVPQALDPNHVLKDGIPSRIAERLLVGSGLMSLVNQGRPPECWYRSGGGTIPDKNNLTIDAAVAIVFRGPGLTIRSGGSTFQGLMGLLNLDNPARSTFLAGTNTLNGVYADGTSIYKQLPMTDQRCSWGMELLRKFLELLRAGGNLPPPPAFAG